MGTDNLAGTPADTPAGSLADVLAGAAAVLFDFDGPLCDVFAAHPAPRVARALARVSAERRPALGTELTGVDDPLEVLRLVHAADPELGLEAERALTAAEVEAVGAAGGPTPGAVAALEAVRAAGLKIAVVSDHSADCVHAFLDRYDLSPHVLEVVGRVARQPDLMRPNPYALITAAGLLGVDVTLCALVGASVADVEAAHAVGSAAIGFADEPRKLEALTSAGAESVTASMAALADAVRPRHPG
ncbi:HAD family hydrolase [Streptomyces sp. SP18CS02]|uniref:HAD family hydrolase n=1 Tax=Streptomyces sp. SP18CS02 TaxID=3002531 RepID=UPI002E75E818|nr:HAD family phosphatase [Streptomyces sp. SP18CS02]MEE1755798.1 HAD family phosphatase [Streptomyces sp. SP18CS02]